MATLKRTDELMRRAAEAAAQGIQQANKNGQTGTQRGQNGVGAKARDIVQNPAAAGWARTGGQTGQKLMGEERSGYSYTGARPSYSSPYSSQIDNLLNSILNREDFSYDVDSDPLYQQYRAQYTREGDRAMRDTMGQAAALTGGYGSSYAATAGTQANDYYMSQLNDRIPELEQLAYQKYQNDINDRYNQLSAFQGAEQMAYGQYRDQMGDYQTDRAFDYGLWGDAQAQENWQGSFDYQKAQDALSQQNWQSSMEYQKAQDALAQQNWAKEFEYQKQQDALAYALKQAAASTRSSGGSGRSSGSSGGGFDWGDSGGNSGGNSQKSTQNAPNYSSVLHMVEQMIERGTSQDALFDAIVFSGLDDASTVRMVKEYGLEKLYQNYLKQAGGGN